MDFKDLLLRQAQNFGEKRALVFQDRDISFEELKNISFRLGNFFLSRDIGRGDKIAIFLPNIPEAVFSFLGGLIIGSTIVPLDFMLTEEEIVNFINHSEAKVLITQPRKGVNLERVRSNCPALKEIIVCRREKEDFSFWERIVKESSTREPGVRIEDEVLSSIFYTSGSTAHPKGVMLSFKHLDNPVKCMDYFLDVSDKDILLCGGVPFSHIGGLDYIIIMLHCASTLILMERFKPCEFLKNIEKYRVTFFWIVPSMYVALLHSKEYDRFDLSSLRYAVVFGAPSSPELLRRFHKICPNAYLLNGWGMTETSAPNCVLPPALNKIESVGKFTPWMQARIVSEDGKILGPFERGELWVKGWPVMKGYFKEEDLTRNVFTEDGWLKTGDIAYYDSEGLFYIVGRKKDMIKVAGEIVFSGEVEEVIYRYPLVKEVAVIGVKDRLRGEVPRAFIVPKGNIDLQELRDFLKQHLAHFKIPHYFEFVKELPKTRTGKIDKRLLKEEKAIS